ncbi:MAG: OmpA family protein [Sphingomonadaceae bacterium]
MRPGIETPTFTPPPLAPLDVRIGFPEGGAKLDEQAVNALEKLVASPQVAEGGTLTLGAHTDSKGCDDANLRASEKRGEAVKAWLVDHGIAEKRISLTAFGEQNPIAPNAKPDGSPDEEGRAKNRRVEIHVAVEEATPDDERKPTLVEEIEERSDGKPSPNPSPGPTPSAQATPQ